MNSITEGPRKALVVARYTFIEIIKSKILLNVAILGAFLLSLCYVAFSFTFGVPERVALDIGLGSLSFSSVGIAIFMGVGLIANEIESRTIYMVLSRPIDRWVFLSGRILGMVAVLILNIIILSTMTMCLYLFLGGKIDGLILWAILFSMLESTICLLVVIFFSLITNSAMSVVFTVTTYIVGHALTDTFFTLYVKLRPSLESLLRLYSIIFPNFSKLNIKEFILYKQVLPGNYLLGAFGYGMTYILLLLVASSVIIEKKNLD